MHAHSLPAARPHHRLTVATGHTTAQTGAAAGEARQAATLLDCAAGFIERGWTTDAHARRPDGDGCCPESPEAACWCAQGALHAASHRLGIWTQRDGCIDDRSMSAGEYEDRSRVMNRARAALREAIVASAAPEALSAVSVTLCITTWNDDEAGGGAVVAGTMRRAAGALREAGRE